MTKKVREIISISEYIDKVKAEGFFVATFDMTFLEMVTACVKSVCSFVLFYKDLFVLYPVMFFMFTTFLIGKNRFTRYIIPLWFLYFVFTIFDRVIVKNM